jgi:hypothetical protein
MWYDSYPLGNQYWTSGAANGTAHALQHESEWLKHDVRDD